MKGEKEINRVLDSFMESMNTLLTKEKDEATWLNGKPLSKVVPFVCEYQTVLAARGSKGAVVWPDFRLLVARDKLAYCPNTLHRTAHSPRFPKGKICRWHPFIMGTLIPKTIMEAAEAALKMGGTAAWGEVMATVVKFDATAWRLWRLVSAAKD